jgi:hypothetical protein
VSTNLSAKAFARGLRGGILTASMPTLASADTLYIVSYPTEEQMAGILNGG